MNPDQLKLVFQLVQGGGLTPIPHDEFLKQWPAADGSLLAEQLIQEAVDTRDSEMLGAGMVVGSAFGNRQGIVASLNACATEDWHRCHEAIANELRDMADPSSVDALKALTVWVPDYLRGDDMRVLAVNAIYALNAIDTPSARSVLETLKTSTDENILRGLMGINLLEDPEDVEFVRELVATDTPLARVALVGLRGSNDIGIRRAMREGDTMRKLRDIELVENPDDVAFVHELAASGTGLARSQLAYLRTSTVPGIQRGLRELGLLPDHAATPSDTPTIDE